MNNTLSFDYIVPGDDFTRAGEASSDVKHKLKQIGYDPDAIRRVAIVGAGTIGASWAALFLAHGLEVVVSDPSPHAEARR